MRRPVLLSALSMILASAVAIAGFYEVLGLSLFCTEHERRGANIVAALVVALTGSVAGLVLLLLVRKWRHFLAVVLLLVAATLGVAIGLVALDSATFIQKNGSCGLGLFGPPETGTSTGHFWYLYLFWGVAIAVLLVGAGSVLGEAPPFDPPKSRYDQPGWSQQPPAARHGQQGGQ
jgi:hypothetical protein